MDALFLVLQFTFRSFVVLLPIVVGGLAFRRLTKSKTANSWIYAVTCLFAAVVTAGLLPWAVGLSATSWVFFVLAAFCPAVWFAVTTICDVSRRGSYETDIEDLSTVMFRARRKTPPAAPLLLSDPVVDLPIPTFTHGKPANIDVPSKAQNAEQKPVKTDVPMVLTDRVEDQKSMGEKSVLEVAREMRRNKSSEERRPKLLPAPTLTGTA